MRIAVNTRLLLPSKLDGIGWFSYETVRRLVADHPEHQFYFFFDRKPDPSMVFGKNVVPVVLCPQSRHPLLWWLFFEVSVKQALKRYKIDLFLSPDGFMTLDTEVPTLDVIHDINFAHSKGNMRLSHQLYMSRFFPKYAKKATRIATVSQFSRQDIAETYHINPGKIDVVYNGAHEYYRPLTADEQAETRKRYSREKPYFLFVSTILRRKNLANLLLAFDRYKESDTEGHKLVVAGARVWWADELKKAYDGMKHRGDVIMLGRVDAEPLSGLMGSATALVYPSFFEGFGIPIVEAFNAETAVITSNTTSMPEVAGDAALLVNPASVDEIVAAMRKVASDNELRGRLIAAGRRQRELFSWEKSAQLLWLSLMKTYDESR
jgi:glycosyltransferase involved in cell wall biosynthesis